MRMLLVPHILVPVQAPLMGFLMVKAVIDAEILWVVGVISNNYSQNSWRNKSELFAGMFKDTNIAQSFSCGSTKCGYIVNFGLAPFFKSPLAEALNDASHYACGFGELQLCYQEKTDGHTCMILGQYCQCCFHTILEQSVLR